MTDRYSKAMLTLIAGALVAIVAQNAIGPVGAQSRMQRVAICDAKDFDRCATVAVRNESMSYQSGFLSVSEPQK